MKSFILFLILVTNADGCIIAEDIKPIWSEPPKHVMIYPRGPGESPVPKWDSFRIHPEYVKFDYVDMRTGVSYNPSMTANDTQWNKIKRVVDWVTKEIKTIIVAVRRLQTPIVIPRHCVLRNSFQVRGKVANCSNNDICTRTGMCYDIPVPDIYSDACYEDGAQKYPRGQGFKNADLILFITIADCVSISQLAAAVPCHREPTYNTPVAGFVRFCTTMFEQKNTEEGKYRSIFLHELLHVLANPLNGNIYVDENGQQRKNTYEIIGRPWESLYGNFTYYTLLSKLPNLHEFAKKHFNCPGLSGLELENETFPGITNQQIPYFFSHFEQRFFPDALLAPSFQLGNRFSKLEMSLLKDTGWYRLNETYKAVELKATRNKGCAFAEKSCYEYMNSVGNNRDALYPYCVYSTTTTTPELGWYCSANGHSVVGCALSKEQLSVPDMFKYFKNYSTTNKPAEYCPMVVYTPIGDTALHHPDPLCFSTDDYYGYRSRTCAGTIINDAQGTEPYFNGMCHNFSCFDETVQLTYKHSSFTCHRNESGHRKAEAYGNTEIVCPNFAVVCAASTRIPGKATIPGNATIPGKATMLVLDIPGKSTMLIFFLLMSVIFWTFVINPLG